MPELHRISALAETPWQEYLSCSETQLYHFFEPEPGIFLAERTRTAGRLLPALISD